MTSLRVEKKEAKKRAILQAAAQVFADKGFFKATVAEIAVLAQVGKGTIYEYVSSKEELLFAVFSQHVQEAAQQAEQLLSEAKGAAAEKLCLMVDTVIMDAMKHIDLYSLSLEFWSAASAPSLRELFQDAIKNMYVTFRRQLAHQLERGVQCGEFRKDLAIDSLAHCLVGALDGLLLQAWLDRDIDPKPMAREFMHCLIRGMTIQDHKNGETA